jgi:hypothetical protein
MTWTARWPTSPAAETEAMLPKTKAARTPVRIILKDDFIVVID